jgi:chromosome segregation ATPase
MDNYEYNTSKDNSFINQSNLNSLLVKLNDNFDKINILRGEMEKINLGYDSLNSEKDQTDQMLEQEINRARNELNSKVKYLQDTYRKNNEFQRKSTSRLQHELIILKKEKNELQQRITDVTKKILEMEGAIGIESIK